MNLSSRTAYGQFTEAEHNEFIKQLTDLVRRIGFVVPMNEGNLGRLVKSQGTLQMQFWWDCYLTGDDMLVIASDLNQQFPLKVRTA